MPHPPKVHLHRWSLVLALALPMALVGPTWAFAGGAPGSVPTITSPADGSVATTSPLTVTASSAATQVRFTIDDGGTVDTQLVSVSAGTATADLALFGADGSVTVRAADCLSGACNINDDTIGVTVNLTAPVITAPADGKVVGSSVVVKVDAPGGAVQFLLDGDVVGTDASSPYERTVALDGKSQGDHTVRVKQCNAAGDFCKGASAQVTVIKDTKGPSWSDLGVSTSPFYPVNDGYKDTTRLSARVGEKSIETSVQIRKLDGPVVRTIKLGRVGPGGVRATWNGKKDNGDIVPAGRYTFQFVGSDTNGVIGKSNDKVVQVSDKKLEKRQATKTVSALGSLVGNGSGECSDLYRLTYRQARFDWPKGIGYYSNTRCQNGGDTDVALGAHAAGLAKATRYGNVSVQAYGAGASRHAGPAALLTVKADNGLGATKKLGTSPGWYGVKGLDADKYLKNGRLRWAVGTSNGNWYDVKEFRIRYTYFVLR